MMHKWSPLATSRYQDHVVAHVLGSTALGFVIIDDAAYVLLDIGLIWTVYTSGEMALMPQAVVIHDLDAEASIKAELAADVGRLHGGQRDSLARMKAMPADCLIHDVKIYAHDNRRLVLLRCEEFSLAIEGLPETGEINVIAGLKDEC